MQTLTKKQERDVVNRMAKEFLEYRLGIEANPKNIQRLATHIIQFEEEVSQQDLIKPCKNRPC